MAPANYSSFADVEAAPLEVPAATPQPVKRRSTFVLAVVAALAFSGAALVGSSAGSARTSTLAAGAGLKGTKGTKGVGQDRNSPISSSDDTKSSDKKENNGQTNYDIDDVSDSGLKSGGPTLR